MEIDEQLMPARYMQYYDDLKERFGDPYECSFLAAELCKCTEERYGIRIIPTCWVANRIQSPEGYSQMIYAGHMMWNGLNDDECAEDLSIFVCLQPTDDWAMLNQQKGFIDVRETNDQIELSESDKAFIDYYRKSDDVFSLQDAIANDNVQEIAAYIHVMQYIGYMRKTLSNWSYGG